MKLLQNCFKIFGTFEIKDWKLYKKSISTNLIFYLYLLILKHQQYVIGIVVFTQAKQTWHCTRRIITTSHYLFTHLLQKHPLKKFLSFLFPFHSGYHFEIFLVCRLDFDFWLDWNKIINFFGWKKSNNNNKLTVTTTN